MYRTLLEGVWLSDIGRMAEVRNVPHLARCEYRRTGLLLIIKDV